jgi:predicted NBD/HSP70 family sugar kinase
LEKAMKSSGVDTSILWESRDSWNGVNAPELVESWTSNTARSVAYAIAASAAVVDLQAAIIDGGIPSGVRSELRWKIDKELAALKPAGSMHPKVIEGRIGPAARAIGAATLPYLDRSAQGTYSRSLSLID